MKNKNQKIQRKISKIKIFINEKEYKLNNLGFDLRSGKTSFLKCMKKKDKTLKEPTAHLEESWKNMVELNKDLRKKGYATNGHFLIKTGPLRNGIIYSTKWLSMSESILREQLNQFTFPAFLKYYAFYDPDVGQGISIYPVPDLRNSDSGDIGCYVIFESVMYGKPVRECYDQKYFNIIRNRYPDAKYGMCENKALIASVMRLPVGKIMKMDGKLPCEDMAREYGYIDSTGPDLIDIINEKSQKGFNL